MSTSRLQPINSLCLVLLFLLSLTVSCGEAEFKRNSAKEKQKTNLSQEGDMDATADDDGQKGDDELILEEDEPVSIGEDSGCAFLTSDDDDDLKKKIEGGPPLEIDISKYKKGGKVEGGKYTFNFKVFRFVTQSVLSSATGDIFGEGATGWVLKKPAHILGGTFLEEWFTATIVDYDSKECKISAVYIKKSINETTLELRDNYNGGCYDGETMIQLADGSKKPIKSLTLRDRVYNSVVGRSFGIKNRIGGLEKDKGMIEVHTSSSTVVVTETHPFLTKTGFKVAKELKVNEYLQDSKGKDIVIKKIVRRAPNPTQMVYNIILDTKNNLDMSHLLVSDGIVTGDLHLQLKLENAAKKTNLTSN